jgi:aryl-alcohol dehydrogenase-like predicted oxidoreductase
MMTSTTTIARRKLGKSNLETAPIVLGGNVFGWTADELASFEILDGFLEAGFNMIDTADSYSKWVSGHNGGESETIIGHWLNRTGKRSQVILSTKVGSEMGPDKKGLSKEYILRAAEASLKRLQTDYIDLYQSHFEDPATPLEETLEAFGQLIKEGKVKAIGASNYSAKQLRRALQTSQEHGLPRYETLQPLYNLCDREDFEEDLAPLCIERGLGVIPYFSLASGFLTGKYRSEADAAGKPRGDFVAKYLNKRGMRILAALDETARKHEATPAQVALAWLIGRPAVTAPIASVSNSAQLDELVGAASLTLDEASIKRLGEASA